MLACNETVTLIHCDGENYTTTTVDDVSWYDKTQIKVEGAGLVFSNAVMVRIPAASAPDPLPVVGDQIIKGSLPVGKIIERPADIAPYHPRKIMTVGDNRRGRLTHVVVIGQ